LRDFFSASVDLVGLCVLTLLSALSALDDTAPARGKGEGDGEGDAIVGTVVAVGVDVATAVLSMGLTVWPCVCCMLFYEWWRVFKCDDWIGNGQTVMCCLLSVTDCLSMNNSSTSGEARLCRDVNFFIF
jgi:hypothetical protein